MSIFTKLHVLIQKHLWHNLAAYNQSDESYEVVTMKAPSTKSNCK